MRCSHVGRVRNTGGPDPGQDPGVMGQDLYLVQSVGEETVVDFTMEEKVSLIQASLL
jgi:hypothetical protein